MGIFDSIFKSKSSILKKAILDRTTRNGKTFVSFNFKKVFIKLETLVVNKNEELVVIENFYPIYNTYGYGIIDFIEDVNRIEKYIDNNPGENALDEALDLFSKENIREFNRLVDADLYRNISIFITYISAHATMIGEAMNNEEKMSMSETFAYKQFEKFGNFIYRTKYRYENGRPVPYLEKYR
jgi:hypothetical protein